MDTKKFKINTSESIKGGKHVSAKSIFAKAGFTVGGAVGGAAVAMGINYPGKNSTTEPETAGEEDIQDVVAETQQSQQLADNNGTSNNDDITEPQPINNNPGGSSMGDNGNNEPVEDVDPRDVAESIAEEIDPNDIDSDDLITIDKLDYAYMPDGTQQIVAIGHTPDGEQYILADIDGDGMYSDIFDIDGNFLAEVPELSLSDLTEMTDDTGGYLAAVDEPWDDDPVPGIIDGDDSLVAEAEEVDSEDVEEDLLAQLLDDAYDDDEGTAMERFFEDQPEDEDSEDDDFDDEEDSDEEYDSIEDEEE